MGMAASLVMWPWPFEGTFVPPAHGGSTQNLASINPVASEMFENVDDRQMTDAYLYYNHTDKTWALGSGELKIWFYHRIMYPKDAGGMAKSVDPGQSRSSLIWVYTVCLSVRKLRIITVIL